MRNSAACLTVTQHYVYKYHKIANITMKNNLFHETYNIKIDII